MKKLVSSIGRHTEILPAIDHMVASNLGQTANNHIEYIFTKPKWDLKLFRFNSSQNPYGHSTIKYFDRNSVASTIMNVSGYKNRKIANFYSPDQYLFTDQLDQGNQQGGVFNRSFISIRVDNLPTSSVISQMDTYYRSLVEQQNRGEVKFTLLSHLITNRFRPLFHQSLNGNCSFWTGNGLVLADLVKKTSSFPLLLFFKVFYHRLKMNMQNTHIIAYRSIDYKNEPKGALIYPFYWLKHGYSQIWNLDQLANIIVEFRFDEQTGQHVAQMTQNPRAKEHWDKLLQTLQLIIRD